MSRACRGSCLNLSPIMAKYVTNGNMDAWVNIAADIARKILETARRDVLLIPHSPGSIAMITSSCAGSPTAVPRQSGVRRFAWATTFGRGNQMGDFALRRVCGRQDFIPPIAAISSAVPNSVWPTAGKRMG